MSKSPSLVRLQKYIADCGITSRRKAEQLILDGVVKVNNMKVTTLGTKVDPQEDVVEVNGKMIDILTVDHIYLVMNKPRGFVTTVSDPEGRKTVMDLIPIDTRVFPVGRLDYLSEGLLLFTNDGDLANTIIHPRNNIIKTYEVKVFGKINDALLKKLKAGTSGADGQLRPKSVRVIEQLPNKTWLEFRLSEGKNREIRRICEAHGVTIDKLKRVAIGGLSVTGIAPGKWEYITKPDLLKTMGLKKDGTKKEDVEFFSRKKTVDVKKFNKRQKDAKAADDEAFSRYRKGEYYETLRIQKEAAKKRALDKAQKVSENIKVKPSFQKKKR